MADITAQRSTKTLYELLTVSGRLVFIFRTGQNRRIVLQAHQRPLSNLWLKEHDITLHKIRITCHVREDGKYLMVQCKSVARQERFEYLVKCAILDLHENYNWEVYK